MHRQAVVVADRLESSSDAGAARQRLSDEQLADFDLHGYVVLASLLSEDALATLKQEVDRWVDTGLRDASIAVCANPTSRNPPEVMELELGEHGWLISHPPLMAILEQLLGPGFAFHHMHSVRQDPGIGGKDWHHDYEQQPQVSRTHAMVHAFHYLSGLDGTVGDLVLLPGSHRIVAGKGALCDAGTDRLAGEVVLDDLAPGSTVIVHSALFHARRPQPACDGDARYFIDAAYCQAGVAWPAVKPYWVGMLARARELGLDRGMRPELFDEGAFYEPSQQWPLLSGHSEAASAP